MNLDKVFIALDQLEEAEIDLLIANSNPKIKAVKIGLELFLKHGHEIINRIHKKHDVSIFLDLKLHDIPKTVEQAVGSLAGLPIKFLTIHLAGGREMILSAIKAQEKHLPNTEILGVSYLTSLSNVEINEVYGFDLNEFQFEKMFELANNTKIHGIVCSPLEISLLRKIASPTLKCVTPGVRFDFEIENKTTSDDQKRILSIKEALKLGPDYLVIGRSITKASSVEELNRRLSLILEM